MRSRGTRTGTDAFFHSFVRSFPYKYPESLQRDSILAYEVFRKFMITFLLSFQYYCITPSGESKLGFCVSSYEKPMYFTFFQYYSCVRVKTGTGADSLSILVCIYSLITKPRPCKGTNALVYFTFAYSSKLRRVPAKGPSLLYVGYETDRVPPFSPSILQLRPCGTWTGSRLISHSRLPLFPNY